MTARSHNKGFTLVEIIVAITILGTGLVTVIGMFSGGLRSAALSNDYSKALFLARKKIGELEVKDSFSGGSGTFNTKDFNMYRWKVDLENYPFAVNPESKLIPKVLKVKVTISWKDGKGIKKIELVTLKTTL